MMQETRRKLLQNLIQPSLPKGMEEEAVKSTDGFSPLDLKRIALKISTALQLNETSNFSQILSSITTLSMTEVVLNQARGTRTFDDVGGLDNIKKTLMDSVVLPAKVILLIGMLKTCSSDFFFFLNCCVASCTVCKLSTAAQVRCVVVRSSRYGQNPSS